jgi:hypothetical protein
MTILNALKADHDELKGMLKAILATKDGKKRSVLFAPFKSKLTAHSRAEERVFYQPLERTQEGMTEALEGTVEHQVADRLLADLAAARQPEAETWTARCSVLQELLEHHIHEEEGDFLKRKAIFSRPPESFSIEPLLRRWAKILPPRNRRSRCRRSPPPPSKHVGLAAGAHASAVNREIA